MGIVNKAIDFVFSPVGAIIGGTVGKLMVSAGMILAGVVTGNPGFITMGVAKGMSAFQKKPKVSPATADRLHAALDPTAPRKIVFGRTAMATDVRYQSFTGSSQEYYHQIVCVASHEVEAIEEIWFDSELAWTAAGGGQGKFAGYLTVTPRLVGTAANGIAIDGVWTAACTLTGCAYYHARFKLTGNGKKAESPFSQTIPSRVTVIGKGMKVYDPRFDSSAGGSGAMRAHDQATWAWFAGGIEIGRNPVCQETSYQLGWRINGKLAVGRGIPAARIDMASRITGANLCDETVSKAAGGSEPRYRSDGIFSEADDPSSVLGALRAAMAAEPTDANGRLAIRVDHNDLATPAVTLSEADIVDGDLWVPSPPLNEIPNIVRGRYTDPTPSALYQMLPAPDVKLASSDGIDRFEPGFDLGNVQSPSQHQRLAKMRLQRRQYQGLFSARFKARAWAASYGCVVNLNYAPLGWAGKKFRVVGQKLYLDGTVDLVLRETSPAIYAWLNEDSAPVAAAVPTIYDPTKAPILQQMADLAEGITGLEAAVDGKVTTFFGPGTPAAEATGDLWFKTDTKKWYRWDGDSWELAEDGGIGAAIAAAAGAQATADGKVATYNQQVQPAAPALGDLWVQPSAIPKVVRRWNGALWVEVANLVTQGADIGVENGADVTASVPTVPMRVKCDHQGAVLAGELPQEQQLKLYRNGTPLTAGVAWDYQVLVGEVNGVSPASGFQAMAGSGSGTFAVATLATAYAKVRIRATNGGFVRDGYIVIEKELAPPPTTGGSSGGSGGSAATQTISTSTSSTSNVAISPECVANVGSAGTVSLSAANIQLHPPKVAGSWAVYMRWQWHNGAAWVDIGTESSGTSSTVAEMEPGAPTFYAREAAFLSNNLTHTNSANATGQRYRLVGRISAGAVHAISGTINAQG